ncbi:Metallo-peptidase family M12-domain-containing protein [Aspergillus unguis]
MWEPVGWTRIYIKEDGPRPLFEGVFNVRGDNHHVQLKSTYLQRKRPQDVGITKQDGEYMVFYRDSDLLRTEPSVHTDLKRSLPEDMAGSTCHADKLDFNNDPEHPVIQSFTEKKSSWASMPMADLFGLSFSKRDDINTVSGNGGGVNLQSTIGDTSGCPDTKRVALVGIATDCSFWEKFNGRDDVQESVVNIVNSASDVFESAFNISLGLRNLTITDKDCTDNPSTAAKWNQPCSSGNITSRLDQFSDWRGQQSDDNAYWTLMTDCNTGAEVGLAWLGQLCNNEVSGSVSGTNVVVATGSSGWQIFAHESGHTFGAVHDCTSQTCSQNQQSSSSNSGCCPLSTTTCSADGDYIMNPSTNQDVTKFSPCTIGNVCSALGRNTVKSTCLSDNKGIVTYTGAQCGNGIVEEGEDCDCGGSDSCGDNSCCDASTCKFKDNAVCDDANDSCCVSCQFASSDYVCRPSTGECDIEETCTGNSSTCPTDTHKNDGDDCGSSGSGLKCASGQCTSRDLQCQNMLGSQTGSNDTSACNDSQFPSCQIFCSVSTGSFMTKSCTTNSQNYVDGTPCDNGGTCQNGTCEGSKNWFDQHKNIIIPVVAAVGGLIVLAILISFFRRCRRQRRTMKPMAPVPTSYNAWPRPMPPPPQQTQMRRLSRAPGPGYGQVPPGPPPGHYPTPYGAGPPPGPIPAPYPGYDGPPPGYSQTVRYA